MTRSTKIPLSDKWETLSNGIYILLGILKMILTGNIVFALGMITLGIGSGWYHLSKKWPIQVFDFWGIYFVQSIIAASNFSLAFPEHSKIIWLISMCAMVVLGVVMGKLDVTIGAILSWIPLAVSLFFVDLLISPWIVIGIYVAAGVVRQLTTHLDHKDNIGHIAWHLLTAPAQFLSVP